MEAQDIKSLLDAIPFEPFTVSTTRTGSHMIGSAGGALLTTTALYVGKNPNDAGIPTEISIVPLMQIASIGPEE